MTNQEYWEKLIEKYENMSMSEFAKLVDELESMEVNPFAVSGEDVDKNASYKETKIIDDVRELKDLIKNAKEGYISKYPMNPERSCYMDEISFRWDPEESVYDIQSERKTFKPFEFSYLEILIPLDANTETTYTTSDEFGENVRQFFCETSTQLLKNASTNLYET